MSSATVTPPPAAMARLVVDTDVASFVFKWHPAFAPQYVAIMRGSELVVSFMTLAEMRQGALDANWGLQKRGVLETCCARCGLPVRNERARAGHGLFP
jgi:predicted nucleic acid-binding protein